MHAPWHLLGCLAVVASQSLPASAAECNRSDAFTTRSDALSDGQCPGKSGRVLIQQGSKTQSSKGHKGHGKEFVIHPSQMVLKIDGNREFRLQSIDEDSEEDSEDMRTRKRTRKMTHVEDSEEDSGEDSKEDSEEDSEATDLSDEVELAMAEVAKEDSDKPKAKAKAKASAKASASGTQAPNMATVIRPNSGKQADLIQVGILVKKFMGVKFGANQFEADVLVTSKWLDDRAKSLLKKGSKTLSVSGQEARTILWVPDITITNRMFEMFDLLSSVVQVHSNGTVMKIDRYHATMVSMFRPDGFPFDSQALPIKIASSTLMVDQLRLEMDPSVCGVEDDAFEDNTFAFLSSSVQSYEEYDGPLKKSRGKLEMTVKRKTASCMSTVLLPCVLIATISFAGFFMPCSLPAFMMPRVATSFVSFLMQVTLDGKIDSIQPERNSDSWLDILHACLERTVYIAVVANIIVIYTAYYHDHKNLGKTFDEELQILLPVLTAVLVAMCFSFAGMDEVSMMKLFTDLIFFCTIIPYLISMMWRIRSRKKTRAEEAENTVLRKVTGSELPAFKPAPAPVHQVQYVSTSPAHQ